MVPRVSLLRQPGSPGAAHDVRVLFLKLSRRRTTTARHGHRAGPATQRFSTGVAPVLFADPLFPAHSTRRLCSPNRSFVSGRGDPGRAAPVRPIPQRNPINATSLVRALPPFSCRFLSISSPALPARKRRPQCSAYNQQDRKQRRLPTLSIAGRAQIADALCAHRAGDISERSLWWRGTGLGAAGVLDRARGFINRRSRSSRSRSSWARSGDAIGRRFASARAWPRLRRSGGRVCARKPPRWCPRQQFILWPGLRSTLAPGLGT